jgi:hypothetical protein
MSRRVFKREEYSKEVEKTTQLDSVVSITLDKKEYKLEFTNRAVKGVFDDTGYNILSQVFDRARMQDPKLMGSLLFRGLQKHHPDLTQEGVDDMFSLRHYPYILDRLTDAMDMYVPKRQELEEEGEESQNPTQRSGAPTTG